MKFPSEIEKLARGRIGIGGTIIATEVNLGGCVKCVYETDEMIQKIRSCDRIRSDSVIEIRLVRVRSLGQFKTLKKRFQLDDRYVADLNGKYSEHIKRRSSSDNGFMIMVLNKASYVGSITEFDC